VFLDSCKLSMRVVAEVNVSECSFIHSILRKRRPVTSESSGALYLDVAECCPKCDRTLPWCGALHCQLLLAVAGSGCRSLPARRMAAPSRKRPSAPVLAWRCLPEPERPELHRQSQKRPAIQSSSQLMLSSSWTTPSPSIGRSQGSALQDSARSTYHVSLIFKTIIPVGRSVKRKEWGSGLKCVRTALTLFQKSLEL